MPKTETKIATLPSRYTVSEGQKPNPNFGKAGHKTEHMPAINAGKDADKDGDEEQPIA